MQNATKSIKINIDDIIAEMLELNKTRNIKPSNLARASYVLGATVALSWMCGEMDSPTEYYSRHY